VRLGANGQTLNSDIAALGAAYLAIRGREQMLINHHGGARSMVDALTGRRGTSGNTINGVGIDNPMYYPSLAAAAATWPEKIKLPTFTPARPR